MGRNSGIRKLIPAIALVLGIPGHGLCQSSGSCPGTISDAWNACDSLLAHNDSELLLFEISFKLPEIWLKACDKITGICNTPPPGSDSVYREHQAKILEYTQALFGTYDVRWPDSLENRAAIPTEDKGDTTTGIFHQMAGGYFIYATKNTILAIAAEPYVRRIEGGTYWRLPEPASSLLPSLRVPLVPGRGASFNLNGQRLRGPETPGFRVRWRPNGS